MSEKKIKEGDTVRYYPVSGSMKGWSDHKVKRLVPEGIPSCREPMVYLESKDGLVLLSHCYLLDSASDPVDNHTTHFDDCGCLSAKWKQGHLDQATSFLEERKKLNAEIKKLRNALKVATNGLEFYANSYCDHEIEDAKVILSGCGNKTTLSKSYGHYARCSLTQIKSILDKESK